MIERMRRGEVLVGFGVVVLAVALAVQAREIAAQGVGSSVGPNVAPWFVALVLGLLGAALVVEAMLRPVEAIAAANDGEERGPVDKRCAAWMLLGLLLNVGLIEIAGFILASTLLFVCTARAFNSERPLRDAGIGFALALVAYVGFDRLLGYKIGTGLIERFI